VPCLSLIHYLQSRSGGLGNLGALPLVEEVVLDGTGRRQSGVRACSVNEGRAQGSHESDGISRYGVGNGKALSLESHNLFLNY